MITQNSMMCLLLSLHVISPSLPAQVCHPLLYSSQVLQCKQTEFASLISGGFLVTRMLQEDWQVRMTIIITMMIIPTLTRLLRGQYQYVST